jgi:hypothetical protein
MRAKSLSEKGSDCHFDSQSGAENLAVFGDVSRP